MGSFISHKGFLDSKVKLRKKIDDLFEDVHVNRMA